MPMSFIQPALLLALPIQLHWSRWNASYWDSLVLMAPSFMAFRVALIVCMHFLLRNIKQVRPPFPSNTPQQRPPDDLCDWITK